MLEHVLQNNPLYIHLHVLISCVAEWKRTNDFTWLSFGCLPPPAVSLGYTYVYANLVHLVALSPLDWEVGGH